MPVPRVCWLASRTKVAGGTLECSHAGILFLAGFGLGFPGSRKASRPWIPKVDTQAVPGAEPGDAGKRLIEAIVDGRPGAERWPEASM
jgi:hypothetical protein